LFRSSYRCQEIKEELKRVKRQLNEKDGGKTKPDRMPIKLVFYIISYCFDL
jgi:hypothetical protein